MFYKEKEEPELREELFENPGAAYRGAPFWAWNKKLNNKEALLPLLFFHRLPHRKKILSQDIPYPAPLCNECEIHPFPFF